MAKRNIKITSPFPVQEGSAVADFIVGGQVSTVRVGVLQRLGITVDTILLDKAETVLAESWDVIEETTNDILRLTNRPKSDGTPLPPSPESTPATGAMKEEPAEGEKSTDLNIHEVPPEMQLALAIKVYGKKLPEFELRTKSFIVFGPQNPSTNVTPDVDPGDLIVARLWKSRNIGGKAGPRGPSSFQVLEVPAPLTAVGKPEIMLD